MTKNMCRDAKDDYLIMLAISGGADFLVTGDKDLLVLDGVEKVRVITPSTLMEELSRKK